MRFNKLAAIGAVTVAASTAVGFTILADDEEPPPPSEPGELVVNDGTAVDAEQRIQTSGTTYDPTVLTKFVPGSAFVGQAEFGDIVEFDGPGRCISTASTSAGNDTQALAPVELPDGAKINRLVFHGVDSNAANITITLRRVQIDTPPAGVPTRSDALVASFNTGALTGIGSVSFDVNPDEIVGSFESGGTMSNRFHTVQVSLNNAAMNDHVVCGVSVEYQVAAPADQGTVFHPIDPVRVYDGRVNAIPQSGLLAPNTSKVISVKDGRNAAGAVTTVDAVPSGATAVTYNVTVTGATGPNFVSVTPGGAGSFTTSAINFDGSADIANAGSVSLDASRQIKIWGGDQAGSMFVIIDITGYYLPTSHPNMGN